MKLFSGKSGPITTCDFFQAFSKILSVGDTVYIELSILRIGGQLEEKVLPGIILTEILNTLQQTIGETGTIVVPTFTYSWGENSLERIYDVENSPSKVGAFSEFVRRKPGFERSIDPMFSIVAGGQKKDFYIDIGNSSFGKQSVYERLLTHNAKLISFGTGLFDPTFVHYVEQYFHQTIQKLDYRYLKKFDGRWKSRGLEKSGTWNCFVRQPNSKYQFHDKRIRDLMLREYELKTQNFGNTKLYATDCESLLCAVIKGLKADPHFLVETKVR